MILYHFTAKHFIDKIKKEGINRGFIPTIRQNGEINGIKDYIWLTINSDFYQSWNTITILSYSRTDIRLTVNIPLKYESKIFEWLMIGKRLTNLFDILNLGKDPENWRLFKGVIPPKWIIQIEEKQ